MTHTYTVEDDPKMLRETLCVAQSAINNSVFAFDHRAKQHVARLGGLIDECDRKRPVGPDGKHGERHTAECGCADDARCAHGIDRTRVYCPPCGPGDHGTDAGTTSENSRSEGR